MRLHRFYIKTPISGDAFDVTDRDLVHQWRSVFRYNVGSQVILFDGSGIDYLCIFTSLRNLGATVSVVKKTQTPDRTVRKNIWLCVAILKHNNFDLALQKATELGVNHVVPLLCDRSEKHSVNMNRLKKIAIEASELCGRGDIPEIMVATKPVSLLLDENLPKTKIVLHPGAKSEDFKTQIHNLKDEIDSGGIIVFIGPEGGFSESEIEMFKDHNVPTAVLGPLIIRAETAAIAVSSLLIL